MTKEGGVLKSKDKYKEDKKREDEDTKEEVRIIETADMNKEDRN